MPSKTLTTLNTCGAVAAMLLASAVVLAQGAAPQPGAPEARRTEEARRTPGKAGKIIQESGAGKTVSHCNAWS